MNSALNDYMLSEPAQESDTQAVVRLAHKRGTGRAEVRLVREGGLWKIDRLPDFGRSARWAVYAWVILFVVVFAIVAIIVKKMRGA